MKKYKMIVFLILMSMMLILPSTLKAEKRMPDRDIEGEGARMGERHHGWFSSLYLDEDVLLKMQETRLEYREKILELKNQIEKKELEIEKLLLEKELNFKKMLSIYDEISDLRHKISRQILEQKIEMYKLVPDDKKGEAKRVFFHRFSGKRHKGPGGVGRPGIHGCPVGK